MNSPIHHSSQATSRTGRRRRTASSITILVLSIAALSLAACAPPPVIDAGTRHAPADQARDPSLDPAPSRGCASTVDARAVNLLPAGHSTVTIKVGRTSRHASVDMPVGSTLAPSPLLLSLHPFLMDPQTWDAYSGLARAGTERGYVVVTPHGSNPGPRWAVPGGLDTGTDDLAFLEELLDYVQDHSCVDRNRVFAAGFSAGAAMSQALSCTMPDRFAAIAGSGGVNLTSTCPDSEPTDVLVLHGTADTIVPTAGTEVSLTPPTGVSLNDAVKANAARARCYPTPQTDQPARGVIRSTYVGCADRHRVVELLLIGAGHTWAGSPNPLLELFTGASNTDISATSTVLDFFDASRQVSSEETGSADRVDPTQ